MQLATLNKHVLLNVNVNSDIYIQHMVTVSTNNDNTLDYLLLMLIYIIIMQEAFK